MTTTLRPRKLDTVGDQHAGLPASVIDGILRLPAMANPSKLREPCHPLADAIADTLRAAGLPDRSTSAAWVSRHVEIAKALHAGGRMDLAVLVFRRAFVAQPLNRMIVAQLLLVLKVHDDIPLRRAWLRRALVVHPDVHFFYGLLIDAEHAAGANRAAVVQACRQVAARPGGARLSALSLAAPLAGLYHGVRYRGEDAAGLKTIRRTAAALSMPTSADDFLEKAAPVLELNADSWPFMERVADLGILTGRPDISKRALDLYRDRNSRLEAGFWPRVKGLQAHGLSLAEGFYPFSVILETVNACNARCVMCPVSSTQRVRKRMTDAVFERLVVEMGDWDCKPVVQLHGVGEPLLFKKLADRIRRLRQSGLPVSFASNASLMTESKAREILDADPNLVVFSLESMDQTVFENIRLGLHLEKVVANIERFIELRDQRRAATRIGVNMVRAPETWAEVGQFISVWLARLQRRELIELAPRHNFTDDYSDLTRSEIACTSPFQQLNVTSDGLVTACCLDSEQKMVFGDVSTDSVFAIYNGTEFGRLRDQHLAGNRTEAAACRECNAPEAWAAGTSVYNP